MRAMGKVEINIPLVTWRDGRPRYFASASHRALGFRGEDLRHGKAGAWFTLEEAIAWSQARQAELAERRRAIAAGETTARKVKGAVRKASAGVVTIADVLASFRDDNPRMLGISIVEGRKKRRPLAPATVSYYRQAIALLEKFDGGAVWVSPAQDLTAPALEGILDRVEVLHGLARTHQLRAMLSVAFSWGRRKKLIRHDPVGAMEERLPSLEPRVRYGTVEEMTAFVAGCDALGFADVADVIVTGLFTGQRQADRLGLADTSVLAEGMVFRQGKKRGAPLLIPAALQLTARFEAAARRRLGWRLNYPHVHIEEARRRPWEPDRYRKAFAVLRHCIAFGDAPRERDGGLTKHARLFLTGLDVPALLAAAGVKPVPSLADFRDQDLRDTAVTWLTLAGATKWEVSAITGHSLKSIDEILKHYFGMHPELARAAIAKLEAWHGAQG